MKYIFAVLSLVFLYSTAYADGCKKPSVPDFNSKTYYSPVDGKKGKDLKKTLYSPCLAQTESCY